MLNRICIMGRMTADPELRYTQSGKAVASFTVAVDRDFVNDGQRETDFIGCVAWKQGAEFVSRYFRKGSMVVVEGRLQSRKWQDRDGNNRVSWEILSEHTYFGEPKRDEGRRDFPTAGSPVNVSAQDFREMDGDGDGNPFTGAEGQRRQAQQYGGQQPGMWDQMNEEAEGELPF